MTGTSTEPGILPRSLDVIFNSIDQKQFSSITIKPKHFSSVEYLDSQEQERQEALKEEIIGKVRWLAVFVCVSLEHLRPVETCLWISENIVFLV